MIIAYDTETYEYDKSRAVYKPVLDCRKFVLGRVKTEKGVGKFFEDPEEMFQWIVGRIKQNSKEKRRTYLYAHNAEYDWYAMARKHFLDEDMKYINFRPFLGIYKEKGYFLDTMAFYRTSLANVGRMLGFPKGILPKEIKSVDELKPYLERDVDIVLKAILDLKEKLSKLGFRPRKMMTSGQIAMTSFLTYNRRNYTEKYFTTFNSELKRREVIKSKYPDMVRHAYRGGDNQAYKVGKFEGLTLIDKNGIYAKIMRDMKFPDLDSENLQKSPSLGMLSKYLNNNIGVARVKIRAPTIQIPFLPIRFSGYQIFPSGVKMYGTWTLMEIKRALELGYEIEECDWVVRYNELMVKGKPFNPFKEFLEHLYQLEQKTSNFYERMPIKMIRNNLSGKFGQNRKNKDVKIARREDVMNFVENGYQSKSKYQDKYILVKELGTYIPSYVNPILSTLVTAGGRMDLYEEKIKVPFSGLFYNDTDSLIIKDKFLPLFKVGKELGDWKVECRNQPAKILGEKRYYIGDHVKVSGLHTAERSKEMIDTEETIKVRRMYGLASAYNSGYFDLVGSFNEIEMEMKPHSKRMLDIPDYVDETKIVIGEDNIFV